MVASLPRKTRTFDFSGLSGDVVNGDPLWYPVEGHVASDAQYLTMSNGEPGFRVKAGLKRMLFTGLPLAAFHDEAAAPATFVRMSWTARFDRDDPATFTCGGPMLYHYSGGAYGTDGRGYYINTLINNVTDDIQYRIFAKTGTETFVGLTDWVAAVNLVGFSGDFFLSWRWTLTKSGADKRIILEYKLPADSEWSGLEDFTIADGTGNDTADMLGLGWRSGPDVLDVHGLIVEWDGPDLVVPCFGQSEFTGAGVDFQTNIDANIYSVDREGQYNSPLTDPWCVQGDPHLTWTALDGGAAAGSFVPNLAKSLAPYFPTQCWLSLVLKGGLPVLSFAPPAIASRYDTTTRMGCLSLMTTILAGDGRQPGQKVIFLYFQGTNDAVVGTSQATYESRWNDVANRINELWPTANIALAVQGDRMKNGATQATGQAIRDAQLALIAARGDTIQWFDDSALTGLPGANTGWPDSDDLGLHPGQDDNLWLSGQALGPLLALLGISPSSRRMISMGMI